MAKPSATTSPDVHSEHSAHEHGGGLPAAEDGGNVDDPPPIPRAGSPGREPVLMNGQRSDGVRTKEDATTTSNSSITAIDDTGDACDKIHARAHTLHTAEVALDLATNLEDGLADHEIADRQRRYGSNELKSSGGVEWWRILVRQISNSLTLVLVIAMAISYGTLDFIEGGVINAVILLNIVIGFFQDYRAEQTIASLLAMAAPVCKVMRDKGALLTIKADQLVPGDIVQLAAGDIVPADLRLYSSMNLATDEAMLTGESKAAVKDANFVCEHTEAPIGDRRNIAYSSTTVIRGRGFGIVIATGMDTELGKIQALILRDRHANANGSRAARFGKKALHGIKNALGLIGTPLQVKLSYFALFLFALAILLAVIVFSVNLWDIDNETLIYGICVAVAVIPESLIAVLTITMAVGSQAMSAGNVIVRNMKALEAIGGVTNICSDKTGTLTQGRMLARKAMLPNGRYITVDEDARPLEPSTGCLRIGQSTVGEVDVLADSELHRFFQVIALCNMANIAPPPDQKGPWTATGEPTEIALEVMALRAQSGRDKARSREKLTLLAEHSFDSALKRMTVVYAERHSREQTCFTKGAIEVLLPLMDIDEPTSNAVLAQADAMASEGLRVLCLAYRSLGLRDQAGAGDRATVEQRLTFAGLVGIYDPPRPETARAVRDCQRAGITVHMLTGDHLKTAATIAREIGILSPNNQGASASNAIMAASDFDRLSDDELLAMDSLPIVLARCSPSTKLRMLDALKARGKYCVMTGDGVNDSPALKGADVGVAMGINGSDVSKAAADMVLTDDNFASIVSAIREGRRLFDNIRKFLLHLLVSNIAQVILLLVGLAFKDNDGVSVFPLSPLEILFANLISSSFLAIGLGLEEASADVMRRRPHSLKAGVFTKELIVDKFVYGSCMGCLCLASFCIVAFGVGDGDLGRDCNHNYNDTCGLAYRARGTAYSILTVLLSVMAWEAKHLDLGLFNMYPDEDSRWGVSFFSTVIRNRFLFWAVMAGLVTPFPVIYIPVVNRVVFRHLPLTWEWGLVFGSIVCFISLVESWKAVKRRCKVKNAKRIGGDGEKAGFGS